MRQGRSIALSFRRFLLPKRADKPIGEENDPAPNDDMTCDWYCHLSVRCPRFSVSHQLLNAHDRHGRFRDSLAAPPPLDVYRIFPF